MDKEKIIRGLDRPHYNKKEVKELLEAVSYSVIKFESRDNPPNYIKVGDIFLNTVGIKSRPCVVVRVRDTTVLSVPLTTTNDDLALLPCSGRFFEGSYFTACLLTNTIEHVKSHFIGIYGNNSDLPKLTKELKKYFRL